MINNISYVNKYIDNNHTYFHITLRKNLESIAKLGLIPQAGERSRSIGDKRKLVHMLYHFWEVPHMTRQLYFEEEYSLPELIILTIKTKEPLFQDYKLGTCFNYSKTKIPPEDINIFNCIKIPQYDLTLTQDNISIISTKLRKELNIDSDDIIDKEGIFIQTPIVDCLKCDYNEHDFSL